MTDSAATVVLFDGVCNLCASAVQWIMTHEADHDLRFTSLQSDAAVEVLRPFGVTPPEGDPDTILVVDRGRLLSHSTGALAIARHLRQPYRGLARVAWLVPRPLRDLVYRWVARNRYRWMGKKDECWVPTPERRARFL